VACIARWRGCGSPVLQLGRRCDDEVVGIGDEVGVGDARCARGVGGGDGGLAATGADVHNCPMTTPPVPIPHGLGLVIDGLATVNINFLPASRQGHTVMEPIGGPDEIAVGFPQVKIGG